MFFVKGITEKIKGKIINTLTGKLCKDSEDEINSFLDKNKMLKLKTVSDKDLGKYVFFENLNNAKYNIRTLTTYCHNLRLLLGSICLFEGTRQNKKFYDFVNAPMQGSHNCLSDSTKTWLHNKGMCSSSSLIRQLQTLKYYFDSKKSLTKTLWTFLLLIH